MELCNSPDIFQEKMNELCNGLEYVRAYIDDQLIISNSVFEDHLNTEKIVLKKVKAAGFKNNAEKSVFARDNLQYLSFRMTRQGIMPLPDKVQAIKDIAVQTNKKKLRKSCIDKSYHNERENYYLL